MFEITAEDIALLTDEDLRSLIGRLCESDMRRRGISPSCVTWGGNQNAVDGGLDVRVALPPNVEIGDFIPRPNTGFQVKAEDIIPSKIVGEMRPKDVLRPAISKLAEQSGAYIIVSSKGSVSDTALQNRREAMAQAISDLPNPDALTLDFYDRRRLETWLRDHPAQAPWVRERIGKPLQGWFSFGAWAYPTETVSGEYLLDDEVRIRTAPQTNEPCLSALAGIERIRRVLRSPQGIVRLVGLSGVGKTRFAQALFDDRVGQNSLDPFIAIYTNLGDDPNPQPIAVGTELIVSGKRAVLVIDNCRPELHKRLSEICRAPGSRLSVLTIEYDIREDQPEGTDVFSLEPASVNLIEKLVKHRFGGISHVDAGRIAEFSGGNARIAVALAATIDKSETIAQLSDQELFGRLFQQRHQPDEALLLAAQALSLVYSFRGENVSDGDEAELSPLGALIGESAQEMFKHCAELERRGLIQRRGVWRAVLPHAIANRLASMALQNIPTSAIEGCVLGAGRQRLLKSLSRKLGYLNGSREARSIVTKWLSPDGLLSNIPDLNDLDHEIFQNVAPVAPEETLKALERILLNPRDPEVAEKCKRYLRLLRSLAYDSALFERCTALIVKIAEAGNGDDGADEAVRIFASLFPIYLSGTHATIEQRLNVIKAQLLSGTPRKRALGIAALKAALEAVHFGPGWDFEFGGHSRNYGYWPGTADDVKHWFKRTLSFVEGLACSDESVAPKIRNTLAEQFRGLWSTATVYDELERVCRKLSEREFWPEGWIAVRETIHYDSDGLAPEVTARLKSLEAHFRPKDLVQKVQSIVLPEALLYVGIDSTIDGTADAQSSMLQVETMARELGRAVAADQHAWAALLPALVTENSQQLWSFGGGLAESAEEPRAIWNQLVTQLAVTPKNTQSTQVIRGFLNALNSKEPDLASGLLDDAVESDVLGPWYPILQTAVGIDTKGVGRLRRSLEVGKAGIRIYRSLVSGGVTHQISGSDFNNLLMRIAIKPEGLDIAIEILYMRLSFDEGRRNSTPAELIDIGCELMRQFTFTHRNAGNDYRVGIIAKCCLVGEKGATTVREICRNLKAAVSKSETYAFYHTDVLQVLFRAQPLAALEGFCGGDQTQLNLGVSILDQAAQLWRNPFDAISEADLLAWCDEAPEIRYSAVAAGVTPFQLSGEGGRPQWTNIARKLLDGAPDRVAVLRKFVRKFIPTARVGSRTAIVESNARLLDELVVYSDPALTEFIGEEKARLADAIKAEEMVEHWINQDRDERFE